MASVNDTYADLFTGNEDRRDVTTDQCKHMLYTVCLPHRQTDTTGLHATVTDDTLSTASQSGRSIHLQALLTELSL